MSTTLEQLRRLRRDAGVADTTPVLAPPPAAPLRPRSEVPEHIRRLLGIRAKATAPRLAAPVPVVATDRRMPGVAIADGLYYSEHHQPWPDVPERVDARFARLDLLAREHLVFFDTETTGLAGGTGTRAFMIGAADWHAGGLRLRQLTMATMAAETAMLGLFASWLSPQSVLVSYNGKCYDAPLLNTRYRLARLASPLPGLVHLDLLHPSRRRWKGRWENCRLGTLERQVLGIVREDDLPGAEAPRAWLDYLRGGCARNLRRVAEHNAQDLRSLAALCLHHARLSDGAMLGP
ncbi:ribonuclease H-like domain-containing protein [Arenimonas sp. MALMAid1274]|uniref:ribonuclease H-like domain-containing protein n=1 Tax=Arenimonas sp. MALMAid1274 TaxID=3411630 RepID=UPI003BA213AC